MQSTSPKSVVVAGGGGFIGKPLCRALLAKGYQVTVLTRGPDRPAGRPSSGQPAARHWDGETSAGWQDLADSAFALVNLAGENVSDGRWTPARKRLILESRVNAGRAMAQAVERAASRPAVCVQASASGYYGHTGDAPVDENASAGHGFLAEVAKVWEDSSAPVEAMGVRRAVVRTGLVLGREGGLWPRLEMPFKYFLGGPLGDGKQGFPWIHIQDEVRAILFLLERDDASGPFNLAAPHSVSNREFSQALAKAMKRPCGLAAPAFALRLLFGEMADELFLAGCHMFPRRLLELGFDFRHPQLPEALANLLGREIA